MHYLARLLADPGRRFHVCELAGTVAALGCHGSCERTRKAVTNQTVASLQPL